MGLREIDNHKTRADSFTLDTPDLNVAWASFDLFFSERETETYLLQGLL